MAQGSYAGALDLQMMKRKAQLDREKQAQEEEEEMKPLFGNPVKVKNPAPLFGSLVKKEHNDPLSQQIKGLLGTYEDFHSQGYYNQQQMVGVPKGPITPLMKQGAPTFPVPPPNRTPTQPELANKVLPPADRRPPPPGGARPDQKASRPSEVESSQKKDDRSHRGAEQKIDKNATKLAAPMSPIRIHEPSNAAKPFRQPLPKTGGEMKRPNGAINGAVKPNLPPLHIPTKKPHGPPELENIFQEMKSIDPPLTGIQTPRKEETGHFQFSQSQDKHVTNLFRKGSLHDVGPPTLTKDKSKSVGTKGLIQDLALSDSEGEDYVKKSPVHDTTAPEHASHVSHMSSSESSDGEDSSSGSSDEDSAASESEAETEPASQEPTSQEVPTSWSLENFMKEKPSEKASPPPPTSKASHKTGAAPSKPEVPAAPTASIFADEDDDDVPISKNNQQSNNELLSLITAQFQDSGHSPVHAGRKPADSGHKPADVGHKPADSGHKLADSGHNPADDHEMDQLERERDDRFDNHTEMLSSPETRHLLHENEFFKKSHAEKSATATDSALKKSCKSENKKQEPEKSRKSSDKKKREKKSHKKVDKSPGDGDKSAKSTHAPALANSADDSGDLKVKIKVGNNQDQSRSKAESKPAVPSNSKPIKHNKVAAKSPRNAISSPPGGAEPEKPETKTKVTKSPQTPTSADKKPAAYKKSGKSPRAGGKTTPKSTQPESDSDSSSSSSLNLSESSSDDDDSEGESAKRKQILSNVFRKASGGRSPSVKASPKPPVPVAEPPKVVASEDNNNKKSYTNLKKEKPDDPILMSPDAIRMPDPLISPIYDKNGKNGLSYDNNMTPSIIVKLDLDLVQELLGQSLNTKRKSEKIDDVLSMSDGEPGECPSSDEEEEVPKLCEKPKNGESHIKPSPGVKEKTPEQLKTVKSDENHERTRVEPPKPEPPTKVVVKSEPMDTDIKPNASKEIPHLPKIPKRKRHTSAEREDRSRSHSREADSKRHKSSKTKDKAKEKSVAIKREPGESKHSSSNSSSRHKSKSKEKDVPSIKKEPDTVKTEKPEKPQREKKSSSPPTTVKTEPSSEKTSSVVIKEEKWEKSEYYRKEGKALKHQADKMSSGVGKSIKYLEAVMSFIMCAGAMERDSSVRSQQTFDMYEGTLRLIAHHSKCRFTDQAGRFKKLQVVGLRLHAFIAQRLYKIKKSEVRNLKKMIDDHNRKEQQLPLQAPSPYGSWNKGGAGTPSPMSPTPSPTGSQSSYNGDNRHGSSSSSATPQTGSTNMSSPGTITLPQRIHSATTSYINYTQYLIQSHDCWEQADMHTLDCQDFFKDVDNLYGKLNINDHSITHYVNYVRYAIKKLNQSS